MAKSAACVLPSVPVPSSSARLLGVCVLLLSAVPLAALVFYARQKPEGFPPALLMADPFGTPSEEGADGARTIVINGSGEHIIGRMAKMPAAGDQVTEVKTVSEVDNRTRRDLLTILGKSN